MDQEPRTKAQGRALPQSETRARTSGTGGQAEPRLLSIGLCGAERYAPARRQGGGMSKRFAGSRVPGFPGSRSSHGALSALLLVGFLLAGIHASAQQGGGGRGPGRGSTPCCFVL